MSVYLGGTLPNVLGPGDGAGVGEGGGRGGRKEMNWSYGMAGWTVNEVMSPAWYCLLFWQI